MVMDSDQTAKSPIGQVTSQNQPKSFMSLPKELRDQIYELSFGCKPHLVVLAGKTRPSDCEGPSNPELTVGVAATYNVIYPASFATFGGHTVSYTFYSQDADVSSTATAQVHKGINWSKSLTGILYTNKQNSAEAAPHLYKLCTFLFEDLDLSKRFLELVCPANLESIRNIFVYYPDELEIIYAPDGTVVENTVSMRQKFQSLCEKIVKAMPKVKELTVWIGKILELENEGTRVDAYKRAILQFAGLGELEKTFVKKYGEVFDNSGDEDARWEGSNEYTVKGVKQMIATGDHAALDNMRKAFGEVRDKECEGDE